MLLSRLCPTLFTIACASHLWAPLAVSEEIQAQEVPPPPPEPPAITLDLDKDWAVFSATRLPQGGGVPHVPVQVLDETARRRAGHPWQTIELLDDQPGITLSQSGGISGASSVRIRGATAAGTQVRYAGVPWNDPAATQSGPDLTLLNPAAIGDIEIVKGAQSGLYGSRAVGGVIDLQPLRSTDQHMGMARLQAGSFSTVDGLVQASGPLGAQAGYAVGVSGSTTDGITSRTNADDGDPEDFEEDGLDKTGVYLRGEYMPMEGLTLFGSLNYLDAEAEYDNFGDPDAEDPYTETTSSIGHVGGVFQDDAENPVIQAAADFAFSQIERELPEAAFGSNTFEGQEVYVSARGQYRPSDGPLVAGGLDWRHESAETTTVSNTTSVDESARHVGLWVRAGWSVETWELTATGRYENHSEEADAFTGQVQGVWEFVPQRSEVYFSIGSAYRAPSLYELFAQDDFGFGPIGNADLDSERSWGGEVGHRSGLAPHFRLEQSLFSTRYQERIGFVFTEGYVNQDDHVYVTGIEQRFIVGDLDELDFEVEIAHVWQDVSDPDSDAAWRLPANEVQFALTVEPHDDVEATLAMHSVGNRSDFGGATLNAYTLVNLAVSWQAHEYVEIFARGENLTNEAYELADGFAQPGAAGYLGVLARW